MVTDLNPNHLEVILKCMRITANRNPTNNYYKVISTNNYFQPSQSFWKCLRQSAKQVKLFL